VDLEALEINMIIGISGYARSGKDTFAISLEKILKKNQIKSERIAFANILKKDVDDFLKQKFNISAFTKDDSEKLLIRPVLVGYGEARRNQNPDYWIDQIKNYCNNKLIIITDVRYENEAKWILENKGFILNLSRLKKDGFPIEAANEQELSSLEKVKQISNFNLTWHTLEEEKLIDQVVDCFLFSSDLSYQINKWKATFPL
jgi:hypothetical protein